MLLVLAAVLVLATPAGAQTAGYDHVTTWGPAAPGEVRGPEDIAVGPDGSIYIVDDSSSSTEFSRVDVFDANGTYRRKLDAANRFGITAQPSRVTVAPDGEVYELDAGGVEVFQFAADGTFEHEWTLPHAYHGFSQFDPRPDVRGVDIAAAPDGTLWVLYDDREVGHLDAVGAQIAELPPPADGTDPGFVIDVAPDGTVFVGRYATFEELNPDGTEAGTFELPAGASLAFLGQQVFGSWGSSIEAISRDGSRGVGISGDAGNPVMFYSVGQAAATWRGQPALLVADSQNRRVLVFSPTGEYLDAFGMPAPGTLTAPYAAWEAQDGAVWVADTGTRRILRFRADGAFDRVIDTGVWASAGATNPANGQALVDTGQAVRRYSPDGKLLGTTPLPPPSTGYAPQEGIAAAPDGTIYVTNPNVPEGGSVAVYDADGTLLRQITGPASGPGHVSEPTGVAVGPDGLVYVLESGDGQTRLDVFDPSGTYLKSLGDLTCVGGMGLAIDPQGWIFLRTVGRIVVMRTDGQVMGTIGGSGTELGDVEGGWLSMGTDDVLTVGSWEAARITRLHVDTAAFGMLSPMHCWVVRLPDPYLSVANGVTAAAVSCQGQSTCGGFATLSTTVAAGRRRAARVVVLARAPFSIQGGKTGSVLLRLRSVKGLHLLPGSSHRARLVTSSYGAVVSQWDVTLRVKGRRVTKKPKPRHRSHHRRPKHHTTSPHHPTTSH